LLAIYEMVADDQVAPEASFNLAWKARLTRSVIARASQ